MTAAPVFVDTSLVDCDEIGGIASKSGLILSERTRALLMAGMSPLPAFASESSYPERIDPRKWNVVENQANQGSCQGHSLSTCVEGAYYMATGGTIAFSRQFAYIGSQKVDGINGDSGSTVSGGVRLATSKGLCREQLWPYTGNYHRNPPGGSWDGCEQDAANYKIGQYSAINSYDEAFKFIASRLGWVHTGFMWGDVIDRQAPSGAIERWAPGGGGHSVAFIGYTPEKTDGQGRPYLINVNSWSTRWGNGGYALWSPTAFDAMCNHQWSEVVGLHSLQLGGGAQLPKVFV